MLQKHRLLSWQRLPPSASWGVASLFHKKSLMEISAWSCDVCALCNLNLSSDIGELEAWLKHVFQIQPMLKGFAIAGNPTFPRLSNQTPRLHPALPPWDQCQRSILSPAWHPVPQTASFAPWTKWQVFAIRHLEAQHSQAVSALTRRIRTRLVYRLLVKWCIGVAQHEDRRCHKCIGCDVELLWPDWG